ncbi:hypothetical protein MEZE111188_21100 [Mesobacillus zeae]
MRAVYGNDWSLKYTPLFKFAFMLPIVSKLIPLIRYSSHKWFEILRISEHSRVICIYLREFKKLVFLHFSALLSIDFM